MIAFLSFNRNGVMRCSLPGGTPYTSESEEPLSNSSFARMTGRPIASSWIDDDQILRALIGREIFAQVTMTAKGAFASNNTIDLIRKRVQIVKGHLNYKKIGDGFRDDQSAILVKKELEPRMNAECISDMERSRGSQKKKQ
jgi:hypothetical protein